MRPLLVLAILATSSALVSLAAADHPQACAVVSDPTLDARNENVLSAAFRSTSQSHCVEALDGETVRWTNLDTIPHALADREYGFCFKGVRGDEHHIAPGESLDVALDYRPGEDILHVRMWDADGEPVLFRDLRTGELTPVNECRGAHVLLSESRVVVPWNSWGAPTVWGNVYLRV